MKSANICSLQESTQEKGIVDFKMAGIVCLKRFEDGRWALEWIITPEMVE